MSRFFTRSFSCAPYVPGEQPKNGEYIKLNTNENPYFPSQYAVDKIDRAAVERLRLYSDPECTELATAIAEYYGVGADRVLPSNGSDEALAFCFAAFGGSGAVFPDITYGFYKVFASLFGAEYDEIPLNGNFEIEIEKYKNCGRTVFLANPNAQTGIYLPPRDVEEIVKSNPNNVVVVDEAYIDFGGESVVPLTGKYDNLVVVQTFSKSRSLAGGRIGFAVANSSLIADLKRIKYSFNPYNVNSLSCTVAAAAIRDKAYFIETVNKIKATRARLTRELTALGYTVLPSLANFVLAKSPKLRGGELYSKLKAAGVLVRHFDEPRIIDYVRISIGDDAQIDELIKQIKISEDAL